MASYLLEQYLDRVAALPSDLNRNYTLMRELDTRTHEMVGKLDADCQAFLAEVAQLSDGERRSRLQALQDAFEKALDYSDQKVSLAVQTYETVDKHIRDLDQDLTKMDAEAGQTGHEADAQAQRGGIDDMPVDPNEPTYCICHQVSYGEMIACDNKDCPLEWFHYACVGLSERPKDKQWFCPLCRGENQSKRKKNR